MIIEHSILVDNIPRKFTFQYETCDEAKMQLTVDALVIVKKEEKMTRFTITAKKFTMLWFYTALEAYHGKNVGGGGCGHRGEYIILGTDHQYLFPRVVIVSGDKINMYTKSAILIS